MTKIIGFDVSTPEGADAFRARIAEFNRRSLEWQRGQQEFRAYVDGMAEKLAGNPRYQGAHFVGLRTNDGYRGFVTDLKGYHESLGRLQRFADGHYEHPNPGARWFTTIMSTEVKQK